ncbi:MAG TPA: hypothetical protein PL070_17270 [Flavobacteriales bacterium]|nr:hypothetical protein [Flavobacteriales bacterium]
MADSVVRHHLGAEVQAKYVHTAEQVHHDLSELIFLPGDSIMAWQDRHLIKFVPRYCAFEYEISLDKQEGGATIRFALDPTGQFVQGEPMNGLPSPGTIRQDFAMRLKDFYRVANDHGFHWSKNDRYQCLQWKPADGTGSMIASGTYELTLGRIIGEGHEVGTGCTYLYDIIEGIRFNAYTGEITSKGFFQIRSAIASSPSRL